jgi:hypothetical protein
MHPKHMVIWDHVTRADVLGGKTGAVRVLGHLGFTVKEKWRAAE